MINNYWQIRVTLNFRYVYTIYSMAINNYFKNLQEGLLSLTAQRAACET